MPYQYALKIAYKGTHFYGWQKTKEGPSIEESLEIAIRTITQEEKIILQAASRTDRGVHSLGQIVSFIVEKPIHKLPLFQISLNKLLKPHITCLNSIEIQNWPDFHPTLSAQEKIYRYVILAGTTPSPFHHETSWHISSPLDIDSMQQAANRFCGTHDFYGFCNQRKNLHYESTVRTVREVLFEVVSISSEWQLVSISITGTNFLYKMARNIAGTIAWIGLNKLPLTAIEKTLQTKNRIFAGITAPACGLTLMDIRYDRAIF